MDSRKIVTISRTMMTGVTSEHTSSSGMREVVRCDFILENRRRLSGTNVFGFRFQWFHDMNGITLGKRVWGEARLSQAPVSALVAPGCLHRHPTQLPNDDEVNCSAVVESSFRAFPRVKKLNKLMIAAILGSQAIIPGIFRSSWLSYRWRSNRFVTPVSKWRRWAAGLVYRVQPPLLRIVPRTG